ncbi:MAG: protein phosphatase 2C domain-containing protein [Nocardioides sp.]
MGRVELHYGSATDVGVVREVNEDSLLASPPVFVVADGMGGHSGGDVASRIVVEEFAALADQVYDAQSGVSAVVAALLSSQRRIGEYAAAQRSGGRPRWYAGTTAVVALLVEDAQHGPGWLLANLGDSRVYRVVERRLEQVSIDHSVVQELIDAGRITPDEAEHHPERHVVTRALGGPDGIEPDFFRVPLAAAERLLLCSDGVTGMLADPEVSRILGDSEDPRDAADRLVAAAVSAGGRDNATAVVVDVVGWARTDSYDSAQQRASLEQKLGALP